MSASGLPGGVAGGLLSNLFSIDEVSFGAPLGLRWHGWNLPMTLIGTAGGWFEGMLRFKKTEESHGFFGKIFGFVQDVVGDVLGLAGNIIGSVSPIYRRSEAREQEAKSNVQGALQENERFLGKKLGDAELKRVYSNAAYLAHMAPLLAAAGEDGLCSRIQRHFSENTFFYEAVFSTAARTEAEALISDIEGENYRSDQKTHSALIAWANGDLKRLVESYLYFQMCDERSLSEAQKEQRKEEMKRIEGLSVPGVNWGLELKQKLSLVQVLSSGEMEKHWQAVLGMLEAGELEAKYQKYRRSVGLRRAAGVEIDRNTLSADMLAIDRVLELVRTRQSYGVFAGYIQQWSSKQDQRSTRQAVNTLARLMLGAAEKGNNQAFDSYADWLAITETLFPEASKKYGASSAIEQALEKRKEALLVDPEDIKTEAQKGAFLEELGFFSNAIFRLSALSSTSPVSQEKLKEWREEALPRAVETLYGLTKNEKDEKALQQLTAIWRSLYSNFFAHGVDVFSRLGEEEQKFVFELLGGDYAQG
jgi:hypothetical protein